MSQFPMFTPRRKGMEVLLVEAGVGTTAAAVVLEGAAAGVFWLVDAA